ncbi:MAG TPA: hypothetical protein VFE47_22140 [Tepidisphaeraceae bacterium]|nr:hypothetical protein [Tepidisphaeraceae bacterium]
MLSVTDSTRRSPASRIVPETLETRSLLSVSLNAAGFTLVTPAAGDRVIYCSSSTGNDRNSGLSASQPVATLAKGESLLRNHTGDELLLKTGDTWHASFGDWTLSGASAANPMVIGAYGSGARPIIMTGTASGIITGSSSTHEVDFLDILGIHFWADGRDPSITPSPKASDPTGIDFLSQSNEILVENCMVQDYDVNINFQDYYGPLQNVSVRRNVDVDAWSSDTHAQGLYALGVTNLTLSGNLFDHNGWNTQVKGAVATVYNHDAYISAHNSGVIAVNNIFSNAAATGLQDRPGGIVENNLFLDDPVGLTFGLVNGADTTPGGVHGQVIGNVFMGSAPAGTIGQLGAIQVGNITPHSGTVITSNIFDDAGPKSAPAISLMYGIAQIDPKDSVGINDLSISYNIFYAGNAGISVEAGMTPGGAGLTALNRLSIVGNEFENMAGASVENASTSYLKQETWSANSYYNADKLVNSPAGSAAGIIRSTPFTFYSPNRTVATLDALIAGPGTDAHFIHLCRLQSAANWSTGLTTAATNSYISNGFMSKLP